MKKKNAIEAPPPEVPPFRWQAILATALAGCLAFGLILLQAYYARYPDNTYSLINLDVRVGFLEQLTNQVERDEMCVPLAADVRALDATLAPDARVFVAGMLGPTNSGGLGYYYFLRNYLFPRDVEISLDDKAISTLDGFSGVPCDSPAVLKAKGFDLLIEVKNGVLCPTPLTAKGRPRADFAINETNTQMQMPQFTTNPPASQ